MGDSITLYDLGHQYGELIAALGETDQGDDEAFEQIGMALERIQEGLQHKAAAIAAIIRTNELTADALKAEERRLALRRKARENRADHLRDYLLRSLQEAGLQEITSTRFTVRIRQNPESVQVLDQDEIPDQFIRTVTTTEANKRAILDSVKATGVVPAGVEIVRTVKLEIR